MEPQYRQSLDGTLPTLSCMEKLRVCDDRRLFTVFEAFKARHAPRTRSTPSPRSTHGSFISSQTSCETGERGWPARTAHRCAVPGQRSAWATRTRSSQSISGAGNQNPAACRSTRWSIPVRRNSRAETPYFYAAYAEENEAAEFLARRRGQRKAVLVFGSGPIRIGQGIEFDYCLRPLRVGAAASAATRS